MYYTHLVPQKLDLVRAAIRMGGSFLVLSKLSDCFSHNRLNGGERQQLGQLLTSKNHNSRTLSLTQLGSIVGDTERDDASAEPLANRK